MKQRLTKDPSLEGEDILPLLKQSCSSWSEEDNQRFLDAVRQHGKNYDKIAEAIGKTRKEVRSRAYLIKYKRPNSVEAEILSILQTKSNEYFWTQDEKHRFIAALREHGKDYKKIAAAVGGTKTRDQVCGYMSVWKQKWI